MRLQPWLTVWSAAWSALSSLLLLPINLDSALLL